VPPYRSAHVKVVAHRLLGVPLRSSAMRALGAHGNVFAAESFMDEIAHGRGLDPLAIRLGLLDDPRAQAVPRVLADMGQVVNADGAISQLEGLPHLAFQRSARGGRAPDARR
jgi:xanthine dehydrogenase molybdopterin-binding subunit B